MKKPYFIEEPYGLSSELQPIGKFRKKKKMPKYNKKFLKALDNIFVNKRKLKRNELK